MSDYMTGQQFRDEVWTPTYVKHHHNNPEPYNKLPSNLRSFWDALAARVKMPRPKPPPSLWDVYCDWCEQAFSISDNNVADLLSRLTAAKSAIDEWNATHGKSATC